MPATRTPQAAAISTSRRSRLLPVAGVGIVRHSGRTRTIGPFTRVIT